MHQCSGLYIGIMSGTSLDGCDVVIASFADDSVVIIDSLATTIPPQTRQQLLAIRNQNPSLAELAEIERNITKVYVKAVEKLLVQVGLKPNQIVAIGCHGQTIFHRPKSANGDALSWQLCDASYLTEQTQITTVADFRRRDIAAGGHGAPLAPSFHRFLLHNDTSKCIVNIGGISNITYSHQDRWYGYDCGPGNVLLDAMARMHLGQAYDRNGSWAATGKVNAMLLATMLDDAYFQLSPPKSTGFEYFNQNFIDNWLATTKTTLQVKDLQATLLELTAQTIVDCLPNHIDSVYFCGGGALNVFLMQRLQHLIKPNITVATTADLGVDPQLVESVAFAWFAKQTLAGNSSNIPEVTGANSPKRLGTICYYL